MGAYLSEPITTKQSEDGASHLVSYGVSDMQGWRKNMEDAHITDVSTPTLSIFGVFDGHGGKEVAHFCKHHFAEEARENPAFLECDFSTALPQIFHRIDELLREPQFGDELRSYARIGSADEDGEGRGNPLETKEEMEASIKEKMEQAETKGSLSKSEAIELMVQMMQLKKMNQAQGAGAGDGEDVGAGAGAEEGAVGDSAAGAAASPPLPCEAGCTAVVAVLNGPDLYVANAGDSRGIVSRAGVAHALSYDHKPRDPVELKRIEDAGGYVNQMGRINGNLNLSRSIGDLRYKQDPTIPPSAQIITAEPDVTHTVLNEEDEFMVLAWDVKSNQDVVDFVRERLARGVKPLSKIAEELLDDCICDDPARTQGLGGDNMTCLVVRFLPELFD